MKNTKTQFPNDTLIKLNKLLGDRISIDVNDVYLDGKVVGVRNLAII
jgi:hypothetical protein